MNQGNPYSAKVVSVILRQKVISNEIFTNNEALYILEKLSKIIMN